MVWIAVAVVMAVRWSVGNPQSFTWSNLTRSLLLWPSGASKLIPVLTIEWTLIYELFLSMAIVPLACIGRTRALGWGAGIWLMLILGKLSMNPYAETAWLPLLVEVPLSVINVPFLMGILFYFGMPLVRRYHLATRFLIALTLTAGRLFLETSNGWSLILQSTGSTMLVAILATGKQLDVKNPFVIAGDWTYGIYLIHVSVFTAFFALILRYQWFPPSNSLVLFGGVLALAVGSAFGAFECAMYRRVRSAFKVKKPAAIITVPIPYRPKLKIAA